MTATPSSSAHVLIHPEMPSYGGRTPHARAVVIYGNCQVHFVAEVLSTLGELNDDYRFFIATNYACPGEAQARSLPDDCLRDAALVLRQHEDRDDNPAWLALQDRLPARCPAVTFPSVLLSSLWPFECPEPRGQPEPGYLWKRYPMGDMIGLQIAQAGLSGPLAVAAYLDLSVRKMPDLMARLARDIERMRYQDSQCDARMTDYVESTFQHQHLFWTNGHLSAAGVMELGRRVAAAAQPVLGGNAAQLGTCLGSPWESAGMGPLQAPIHPVVAETLDLRFWQPDMTYCWYSQNWNFYEYIERYIGYDTDW